MNNHQGKIFSGDLFVRKAGTNDGFEFLGNVIELKTKSDVEKKELFGRGKKNYGKAISSITIPKPTTIDIKFDSFDKNALARALMGELKEQAGQVQTISKTTFQSKKGVWVDLGVEDIDPAHFVLKNDSTTIKADNYELNANLGMLWLKDTDETATITDGTELNFTTKTKGRAFIEIAAGTLTQLDLEFKLCGFDIVSQKDGTLHIPHAVLSSDGELNWLSDDFLQAGLTGTLVKESGKDEFTFREYDN